MAAKVPFFPLTSSPVLADFKDALQRRSKAIKHSVFEWRLQRDVEQVNGDNYESLLNCWSANGPELSLRVWEDGLLWFHGCEWIARKLTWELSFHAELGDATGDELVHVLETSLVPMCIRESAHCANEKILQNWAKFEPFEISTAEGMTKTIKRTAFERFKPGLNRDHEI